MKNMFISICVLLFATFANAQYYILYTVDNNSTYTTVDDPFDWTDTCDAKISIKNITPSEETIQTRIEKEEWVKAAEMIYTNTLTLIGLEGVWDNMDCTFESVGVYIVQQMVESLQSGNVEQANLLSTYKGIIKDSYETLLKYSMKYGNDDMRLYPYNSNYIIDTSTTNRYIEYEGIKYYQKLED